MSARANLAWLSAFPYEDEVLYPPLTFLQPTSMVDDLDVDCGSSKLKITVVEVIPKVG
jgi:hypothetical protein